MDDSADSNSDTSDDSDDNDDFDSKHPRWAAGSPGGIGGEFAPRDSGDATNALHEAISEDAKTPIPLDPNSTWAALTSGLDKPSALGDWVQLAGDDAVQNDAIDTWGWPDTLDRHVRDHAADFGIDLNDPNAAEDYANQANDFLQKAFDEDLQTKIDQDGYLRAYDPASNTFGSYNPNGTTRTFFSPPEGQAYFDKQPGELYVGGKPVVSTTATEAAPSAVRTSIINTEPTLESDSSIRGGGGSLLPHVHTNEFIDEDEPKI